MAPLSWAYNKNIENRYPYDPEKSKALLDEAGVTVREFARFEVGQA